jgi:ADP-heptose:LPS heptosyltransferase
MKQKYDHLEVLCSEPCNVVFENNPHVDRIITKKFEDTNTEWFVDRAKEYDFFVNLTHSIETTLALVKAQPQFWWPAQFRRQLCRDSYLQRVHDICGLPHIFAPAFFPTFEESAKAVETKAKVGERCIGWTISGTRLDKLYPWAPFVIARLIREVAPVVLLGGPGKDFEIAKTLQTDVKNQNGTDEGLHVAITPGVVVNGLTPQQQELSEKVDEPGNWPIRRILTFAQHCDLVIGPDTGPMWAVAMCAMPKIMLLSHASPENITKHWINTTTLHADSKRVPCFPCHRLHDGPSTCTPNLQNNGAACISDISPEKVMAAAKELMMISFSGEGGSTQDYT